MRVMMFFIAMILHLMVDIAVLLKKIIIYFIIIYYYNESHMFFAYSVLLNYWRKRFSIVCLEAFHARLINQAYLAC